MLDSCLHVGLSGDLPDGLNSWQNEMERTAESRGTSDWVIRTVSRALVGRTVKGMTLHNPMVGISTEYPVRGEDAWRACLEYRGLYLEHLGSPNLSTRQEAAGCVGEYGMPSVGLESVYGAICEVRGMTDISSDFYDCPHVLEEAVAVQRQITRRRLEGFAACDGPMGWLNTDRATGGHVQPKRFERWVLLR
ncbi:MAG: hypothetical protein ACOYEW_14185 [Anaerolineae bacterium]|jgi:hypothetical protein